MFVGKMVFDKKTWCLREKHTQPETKTGREKEKLTNTETETAIGKRERDRQGPFHL